MRNFIRYFDKNKEKIIKIVVFIVFGLAIIYFLNYLARQENNTLINQNISNQKSENIQPNNINMNSAISVGTSTNTSGNEYKTETDAITKFIEYCNSQKTNEAYNMLSDECKKSIYPTLETFIEGYYNNNFRNNKIYNIQRWAGSIYKVDLKENMLQTGKVTSEAKQDYITVVYQNNEYKLNINNYIRRTDLNVENTTDNLEIKVLYKDTYMDYETYTIQITNNTNKEIYLDNLENTSTIYLEDENENKHVAYIHNLTRQELQFLGYEKRTMQITFSNRYISERDVSRIVFENVIINNEKNNKISIDLD